jgi:hypothetical protein
LLPSGQDERLTSELAFAYMQESFGEIRQRITVRLFVYRLRRPGWIGYQPYVF